MSDVAIDRLTLRLSGMSPERARAIALSIARAVASGSVPASATSAPSVGVSASANPGEADDALAERVARQVLRELGGV